MPPARAPVSTNPLFRLLVWAVIIAFLLGFFGMLLMAFFASDNPTKTQERFSATCEDVMKITIAALIGLLGGRAGTPDRIETVPAASTTPRVPAKPKPKTSPGEAEPEAPPPS